MEKLKHSFVGKSVAVMLLTISIPAAIMLALFIKMIVNEGKFLPGEIDDEVDRRVDYISEQYEVDALVYYLATIEGNKGLIERFKNDFSEEHSNYSFYIETTGGEDGKLDPLRNFNCSSYMRSYSKYYYIIYSPDKDYWYYCHDGENIRSHYAVYEYPEYLLGDGYKDLLPNATDNEEKNLSLIMKYGEAVFNSAYYGDDDYYEDSLTKKRELVAEIHMTSMVKKKLTARDNYYRSKLVRFGQLTYHWMIPLFVISCIIFFLCNVYLIAACGRVRGENVIYVNFFNKIPYDLIVALSAYIIFIVYKENFLLDYMDLFQSVGMAVTLGCIYSVMLCTTVVRIKAGTLLSNTIVARGFCRCKMVIRTIWANLPFVRKYIGLFVCIAIAECYVIAHIESKRFIILLLFAINIVAIICITFTIDKLKRLKEAAAEIASGNLNYRVETNGMKRDIREHADNLNSIGDGIRAAVSEQMKSERMKMELITNVSHDIKTPLTSIINFVDLMSKEDIDNPKVREYIKVLERQSARLKKLIQDLIDASKASSGAMPVELTNVNIKVLLEQVLGEFSEKLERRGINVMTKYYEEEVIVTADGRLLWRVFENLINNVEKYALENTRMYIDVEKNGDITEITIKNISMLELNITGDELMERFVRGDESRNTEGSGLGLSIAKSLMELQGGTMDIQVDGDLFKVVLLFGKNNSTKKAQ